MRKISFSQATLEAMEEEMSLNDKIFVMGEDIARQGGVFGQFKGLATKFPGRVLDTPISETFIIGGGVADHTPIVPLARKKCAEMLNGYIVTPEVNDIDNYIVNNSLEGKQGIMGCLALGAQALQ